MDELPESTYTDVSAVPRSVTFVVSINIGFWAFFVNWHYHALRTFPDLNDHLVVIVEDDATIKLANAMGLRVHVPLKKQESVAVNYDTSGYRAMVSQRPSYLLSLLDSVETDFIFYMDVDTVILHDVVTPAISEAVAQGIDMTLGVEVKDYNGFNEYFCTGIMLIKRSPASREVLNEWNVAMQQKATVNQPIFNDILYHHRNVKFTGFDMDVVASGKTIMDTYGALNSSVAIVHANYLQGVTAKAAFLHGHGLWKRTGNTVVSICTASRSISKWKRLGDSDLFRILMTSVNAVTDASDFYKYDIRLYVGFDDDDDFWIKWHSDLQNAWDKMSHHPLKIIPRFFKSTNAIPWNDITRTAYNSGTDYFVRVNDDSEIVTPGWARLIVHELRLMDNIGVVCPKSLEGNLKICVHDAVHRTHMDLFGTYYPSSFLNWYVDNWITFVYRHRTKILTELRIKHHISPTRYTVYTPKKSHYEKVLNETSAMALAHVKTHEEHVVIIDNGHSCHMVNGGDNRRVHYYDDIAEVMKNLFPTWIVVCHNDTIVASITGQEEGFGFGMTGIANMGTYHIAHVTQWKLNGNEGVMTGKTSRRVVRGYQNRIVTYD